MKRRGSKKLNGVTMWEMPSSLPSGQRWVVICDVMVDGRHNIIEAYGKTARKAKQAAAKMAVNEFGKERING